VNLIVFDLEWNIGYQPKTFLYHGTELTLRGEIIQIGAARINDRGDVLDTFEVNLKPHIFRKLQHHIAKVTGLSQGDLDAGLPMKEGLQKFLDWAGDDAELAEWDRQAREVSLKLGRPCVVLTGPRTDINAIAAACDLFVGVSRSALEAMAAERDDLDRYVDLFGYSPKYGVSGRRIASVEYRPQPYQQVRPLYEVTETL